MHIFEVPNISFDTAAGLLKMRPIILPLITHDYRQFLPIKRGGKGPRFLLISKHKTKDRFYIASLLQLSMHLSSHEVAFSAVVMMDFS